MHVELQVFVFIALPQIILYSYDFMIMTEVYHLYLPNRLTYYTTHYWDVRFDNYSDNIIARFILTCIYIMHST